MIIPTEHSAITPKSSTNDIWRVSNEVLRPAGLVANQMKIIKDGKVIDTPKELSETFGAFFIEKVDGIVEEIKEQSQNEEKHSDVLIVTKISVKSVI